MRRTARIPAWMGATCLSFLPRQIWSRALRMVSRTPMFGTLAREFRPAVRPRRSSFPSRPAEYKQMARPLQRRSTRRAATSHSNPQRPTSAQSHPPAEFSCETLAPAFRAARLPRSRWTNSPFSAQSRPVEHALARQTLGGAGVSLVPMQEGPAIFPIFTHHQNAGETPAPQRKALNPKLAFLVSHLNKAKEKDDPRQAQPPKAAAAPGTIPIPA
jgi:hypothetical protein